MFMCLFSPRSLMCLPFHAPGFWLSSSTRCTPSGGTSRTIGGLPSSPRASGPAPRPLSIRATIHSTGALRFGSRTTVGRKAFSIERSATLRLLSRPVPPHPILQARRRPIMLGPDLTPERSRHRRRAPFLTMAIRLPLHLMATRTRSTTLSRRVRRSPSGLATPPAALDPCRPRPRRRWCCTGPPRANDIRSDYGGRCTLPTQACTISLLRSTSFCGSRGRSNCRANYTLSRRLRVASFLWRRSS